MPIRSSFYRPPSIKIELEIFVSTTAEAEAIVTAIQALPAAFTAANQAAITAATADIEAQLAAEKQNHADDLAAIQGAVTTAAPAAS